ncbi:hypothetical protein ACEPAI_6800 [Sanghuangporus weigelae]
MSKVAAAATVFIVLVAIFGINHWILERKRRAQEADFEMQSFQRDVTTVALRVHLALGYDVEDIDPVVENAGIASQERREKGVWEDIDL